MKKISIEKKLDELILKTRDKELIKTYTQFKTEVLEKTSTINKTLNDIINKMGK